MNAKHDSDNAEQDDGASGEGADSERKRITISLLGAQLNPELQEADLIHRLGSIRYRDAYYLKYHDSDVWLFEYGVLVGWNQSEDDRQQLIFELQPLIDDPIVRPPIEQYTYLVSPDGTSGIRDDLLILPEVDTLTTLAFSHAFAQSAKLSFFEDKAGVVIQKNAYISKQLAATGKVPLSRRQLAKLRGVLFDTSSDITLHFNLLDTPEFFWDYPELEATYQKLAKYLDLTPRIDILNRKLETIQGLLGMLAAEQYHKHSAFLEWVIIVLIALEIVIYFL
ncbi:MAG: RMD1 family protein [Deltaproteobacteria bacterium]|nr:RMD1 family protein [Deltaproteobacteria bacterium]